jgi:hypothetical protein
MLQTLWKLRILVVLAALVVVAGGAVAFAAVEGNNTSNEPTASSAGEHQNETNPTGNNEPTATKGVEPTATKGTEPTAIPHKVVTGKITAVDCTAGTITIAVDNNGGDFTAQLTGNTNYSLSGQAGACSGLKVGWHASIEAQQLNGQWVAQHVDQDDSGQNSGGGGDGGGSSSPTPTPGPNH